MSTTIRQFESRAAQVSDPTCPDYTAWAFELPDGSMMLCVEGEATVILTGVELVKPRSEDAWGMLLLSRGMLMPAALILGRWVHNQQSANKKPETISTGETAALPAADQQ